MSQFPSLIGLTVFLFGHSNLTALYSCASVRLHRRKGFKQEIKRKILWESNHCNLHRALSSNARHIFDDVRLRTRYQLGDRILDFRRFQQEGWTYKVLNKAKIPVIPPLFENDIFVLDFKTKAQIFNNYFILQCTTIDTGSEIPNITTINIPALASIHISEEKILKIIRSLNPNKAHGWDEISVRMIKISDDSLVTPLKIIFESFIKYGIFPEIWKKANIVPVHKKAVKI